jgi:hypothetical protein
MQNYKTLRKLCTPLHLIRFSTATFELYVLLVTRAENVHFRLLVFEYTAVRKMFGPKTK